MRKIKRESAGMIAAISILLILPIACKKESVSTPSINTSIISEIGLNSVVSGGNITNNGGAEVTLRGVCWSENESPTTENSITEDGSGSGSFSSNIAGLSANTVYNLRAYATNSMGTAYGEQITFKTGALTDIDGNAYRIVTIDTQVWMVDNLKTTKYNDGSSIALVENETDWAGLSSPAYCWSDNDVESYKDPYGAIYNWYAVNTDKLCPAGWHVPSSFDWIELYSHWYGMEEIGAKLKDAGTTHWKSPNTGADNQSGFTALPGKFRSDIDGTFGRFGYFCYMWSTTEFNSDSAWSEVLQYNSIEVREEANSKGSGFYVRCVKDQE